MLSEASSFKTTFTLFHVAEGRKKKKKGVTSENIQDNY